jgi:hypothetical protein
MSGFQLNFSLDCETSFYRNATDKANYLYAYSAAVAPVISIPNFTIVSGGYTFSSKFFVELGA